MLQVVARWRLLVAETQQPKSFNARQGPEAMENRGARLTPLDRPAQSSLPPQKAHA
jgi:hypothetical protein